MLSGNWVFSQERAQLVKDLQKYHMWRIICVVSLTILPLGEVKDTKQYKIGWSCSVSHDTEESNNIDFFIISNVVV
jgi:hypothetical protein